MHRHDAMLRTLAALAVIAAVTGCGKSDEKLQSKAPAQAPQATAASQASAPASAPAAAPASPASTSAPEVVAVAAAAAAAIASADGEKPGTRIEVQELKRSGDSLMLKFAVINDSDAQFDISVTLGYFNAKDVYLLDTANKKKYLVIVDSGNKCVCSDNLSVVQPKSRLNLWARFPAPPNDVKKITVVAPHFTPMDDIPITG